MTDLRTLRELAEKATPGPWRECGHDRGVCQCGNIWSVPSDGPVATAFHEDAAAGIYLPLEKMKANAAFIAACDPQTVLALVEAVEALEHIARLPDISASSRRRADSLARAALAPFRSEQETRR